MPGTQLKSRKGYKEAILDEVEINDQVELVDPRMKTGITVIICLFSYCGVYLNAEKTIVLTISGNRSRLEEVEAVLALESRHPARGKLGKKPGRPVRGIMGVVARLVEGAWGQQTQQPP